MIMKPITKELVQDLYTYMSSVYGTSIINKHSSGAMNLVGSFLNLIGVQDKEQFMNDFCTTIGKNIYLPFKIGEVNQPQWNLLSQIIICVHEHQHVVQSMQMGSLKYNTNYLTSKAERTRLEAEAYRSSLEINWLYNKRLPDIHKVASSLKYYGLNDASIAVCESTLKSAARSIQAGAILNQATKTALTILAVK